jgi:hypothetical protein
MTDLNKLADLIKSLEPFEGKRAGSLRVGVDEVRQILSALRDAGAMREALEPERLAETLTRAVFLGGVISGDIPGGCYEEITSGDDTKEVMLAAAKLVSDTIGLALKTEGE